MTTKGKGIRILMHLAAVLVVSGGLCSIFTKQKVVVMAGLEDPAMLRGFPYALSLKSFDIDRYPSGAPRDYTSVLIARRPDGEEVEIVTSVNAPARLGKWLVYQMGCDSESVAAGGESSYSVVECVRDPLYPLIAAGLWALIVLGFLYAFCSVPGAGSKRWLWGAAGGVFAIFVFFTMKSVGVGSGELLPVLRSGWFVPHIVCYMFAYALLTVATVYVCALQIRSRRHGVSRPAWTLGRRFCSMGWALLTAGMCMGALWAKQSWGDWWTFDPKETWALLTWAAFGTYYHIEGRVSARWRAAIMVLSFLLLQMCWWGVNLLPSAGSLHTY